LRWRLRDLTVYEKSYAKINLTLDVLGKRDDGYHEIETIMQETSLHDQLKIDAVKGSGLITVSSNLRYLPCDRRNLAYRAAEAFLVETGIKNMDIAVNIKKKIPVAAGLAGGSSNAAAVLRGLEKIFKSGIDKEKLLKIGASIGADIPFCMTGGTALATGIGEIMTEIRGMPRIRAVLCKLPVSISTAYIYAKMDDIKIEKRPDIKAMIAAIEKGDIHAIARNLCNVMEGVAVSEHGEISKIKETMLKNGALGASMSGSGPTVFGLFDSEKSAKDAYAALKAEYKETYLASIG